MDVIHFFIDGKPKGQPQRKGCIRGKYAGTYDPGTADEWKRFVIEGCRKHRPCVPIKGGVRLTLTFWFKRPKYHFGRGRNEGKILPSAPAIHTSKPDLKNLTWAVEDTLTDLHFWNDDAQIYAYGEGYGKFYCNETVVHPGCTVMIEGPGSVNPWPVHPGGWDPRAD